MTAVKSWTRKKFKGTNALKGTNTGTEHTVNYTRIPIEQKDSVRWLENLEQSTRLAKPDRLVHVGDRESDIYELVCLAQEQEMHSFVQSCVDLRAGTVKTTIARKMQ